MGVRTSSRLEIRLDPEHREKLDRIVEARGGSASDAIRSLIDDATKRLDDQEFRTLLESFRANPIEWPSWEELKKELDHVHCPGGEWCDEPEYHGPVVP